MIKDKILKILYLSKINNLFYYFNRNNQIILTYHNIIPDSLYDSSPHLLVSYKESLFKKHLEIIKKKFKFTTNLSEPGTCIITFDDGYQNNFYIVHKILKEEGIKAIFFISSNKDIFWVDKILLWISYIPNGKYSIFSNEINIKNKKNKVQLLNLIWKLLQNNYKPMNFLKELDYNYPFNKITISNELYKLRFKKLKTEQIKEMIDYGHLICSHSFNHDILSKLSKEELKIEIENEEKLIGSFYNSNFFAYPFGEENNINENVLEVIKNSKFKYAFMNINTPYYNYNKLTIPRFMLLPEEFEKYEIESRLSGLRYFLRYKQLLPKIDEIIKK